MNETRNNNGLIGDYQTVLETDVLSGLISIPMVGVYAFVNEQDRLIQAFASSNILGHLSRIMIELKQSGEYRQLYKDVIDNKVKVVILETVSNDESLKIRLGEYKRVYDEAGYRFYKDFNQASYTIEKRIEYHGRKPYYCIYLMNTRRDMKLIGAFDSHRVANEFISTHYTPFIKDVVYADNDITKKLLETNNKNTWNRDTVRMKK